MRAIIKIGSKYVLLGKDQSVNTVMDMIEGATVVSKQTNYGDKPDVFKETWKDIELFLVPDSSIDFQATAQEVSNG